MPKPLRHTLLSGLEIRHEPGTDPGDGRTLVGLAVPFDVELDVCDFWDDYTEVFRRGAFAKTIKDRARAVQMFVNHGHRDLPIGKAVMLEESDRGLEAEFHLSDVARAGDVLTLVGDGVMNGLSIGFEPVTDQITKAKDRTPPANFDLVERTEVRLFEVSICSFPAYEAAGVSGVRASSSDRPAIADLAAERARLLEVRAGALDRWGRVVRR